MQKKTRGRLRAGGHARTHRSEDWPSRHQVNKLAVRTIACFLSKLHIRDGHRLSQEAAAFIRGPKNSDVNTLTEIVSFPN